MIIMHFYFLRTCIGAFAKRVGDSQYRMMRFVDYMQRCKDNAMQKKKKMN